MTIGKLSTKTQFECLHQQEWNDSFIPYYLSQRKFNESDVRLIISTLTNDADLRKSLFETAKKQLEGDRDAVGTLGEAHLSYMLERRRNIVLTKAGWKDTPFDVTKGTDLVGICLEDLLIVLVQVKTRPNDTARSVTLRNLKNDISLTKLEPRFQKQFGSSSYHTVVATFKKLIMAGKPVPPHNIASINQEVFLRLGAVLTGNVKFWRNIDDADPGDSSPSRPCQLILFEIDALSSKIGLVTAFEIYSNKTAARK